MHGSQFSGKGPAPKTLFIDERSLVSSRIRLSGSSAFRLAAGPPASAAFLKRQSQGAERPVVAQCPPVFLVKSPPVLTETQLLYSLDAGGFSFALSVRAHMHACVYIRVYLCVSSSILQISRSRRGLPDFLSRQEQSPFQPDRLGLLPRQPDEAPLPQHGLHLPKLPLKPRVPTPSRQPQATASEGSRGRQGLPAAVRALAAHPAIRGARALPQLPGGLRAPHHFTTETSALVAGPSLAPLRWGIKAPFPLGLRALSLIVSKPWVPSLMDAAPPSGRGPAFSTSRWAAHKSYLCSCHLPYSVENSLRGSWVPCPWV